MYRYSLQAIVNYCAVGGCLRIDDAYVVFGTRYDDDACLPLIRSSDTPDISREGIEALSSQATDQGYLHGCIGVVRVNSQRSVVPRASRSEPRVPIAIPDSLKENRTRLSPISPPTKRTTCPSRLKSLSSSNRKKKRAETGNAPVRRT